MDVSLALARIPWVARHPPELAERLRAAGRVVHLGAGQWVYGEGEAETGLCLVLDGALRLETTARGDRTVLISFAEAPAVVGQSSRQGGGPRIVTARAARPSVVLTVNDRALETIAANWPPLWRAVNALVYEELESAVRLAAELLTAGAARRIADRLLSLSRDGRARITQSDLAEMSGVTRKTVAQVLAAWERAGLIRRAYAAIDLCDPAGLLDVAGR